MLAAKGTDANVLHLKTASKQRLRTKHKGDDIVQEITQNSISIISSHCGNNCVLEKIFQDTQGSWDWLTTISVQYLAMRPFLSLFLWLSFVLMRLWWLFCFFLNFFLFQQTPSVTKGDDETPVTKVSPFVSEFFSGHCVNSPFLPRADFRFLSVRNIEPLKKTWTTHLPRRIHIRTRTNTLTRVRLHIAWFPPIYPASFAVPQVFANFCGCSADDCSSSKLFETLNCSVRATKPERSFWYNLSHNSRTLLVRSPHWVVNYIYGEQHWLIQIIPKKHVCPYGKQAQKHNTWKIYSDTVFSCQNSGDKPSAQKSFWNSPSKFVRCVSALFCSSDEFESESCTQLHVHSFADNWWINDNPISNPMLTRKTTNELVSSQSAVWPAGSSCDLPVLPSSRKCRTLYLFSPEKKEVFYCRSAARVLILGDIISSCCCQINCLFCQIRNRRRVVSEMRLHGKIDRVCKHLIFFIPSWLSLMILFYTLQGENIFHDTINRGGGRNLDWVAQRLIAAPRVLFSPSFWILSSWLTPLFWTIWCGKKNPGRPSFGS